MTEFKKIEGDLTSGVIKVETVEGETGTHTVETRPGTGAAVLETGEILIGEKYLDLFKNGELEGFHDGLLFEELHHLYWPKGAPERYVFTKNMDRNLEKTADNIGLAAFGSWSKEGGGASNILADAVLSLHLSWRHRNDISDFAQYWKVKNLGGGASQGLKLNRELYLRRAPAVIYRFFRNWLLYLLGRL